MLVVTNSLKSSAYSDGTVQLDRQYAHKSTNQLPFIFEMKEGMWDNNLYVHQLGIQLKKSNVRKCSFWCPSEAQTKLPLFY